MCYRMFDIGKEYVAGVYVQHCVQHRDKYTEGSDNMTMATCHLCWMTTCHKVNTADTVRGVS